jgi:hypothetical protein
MANRRHAPLTWLQLRRNLLRQIKTRVHAILGPEDRELRAYGKRYKAEFNAGWSESSKQALLETLVDAKLVLGGDFHALPQSQRAHFRLLRELPADKDVILMLECFESAHQSLIDDWLRGQISDEGLLRETSWAARWTFGWESYKPLMELAKRRQWQVRGLNRYFSIRSGRSLKVRDQHAAEVISDAYESAEGALVYVIFGDLHLAQKHLPKHLEQSLKRRGLKEKPVLLFQSSERLYFSLARRRRELSVEIMKASRRRYCLMTTPPWVKWQWYLLFLEGQVGSEISGVEASDLVTEMISHLVREFGISYSATSLSVYDSASASMLEGLTRALPKRELLLVTRLVELGKSFYEPRSGVCYVASPSLNQYAEMAGQILQAQLSHRTESLLKPSQNFRARVWIEGLGFFCSKLMNDRRKPKPLDLAHRPKAPAHEKRSLQLALREQFGILAESRGRRALLPPVEATEIQYLEAAQILGGHLGERLYLAYRTGLVERDDIVEFMSRDATHPDFGAFYVLFLETLKPVAEASSTAKG